MTSPFGRHQTIAEDEAELASIIGPLRERRFYHLKDLPRGFGMSNHTERGAAGGPERGNPSFEKCLLACLSKKRMNAGAAGTKFPRSGKVIGSGGARQPRYRHSAIWSDCFVKQKRAQYNAYLAMDCLAKKAAGRPTAAAATTPLLRPSFSPKRPSTARAKYMACITVLPTKRRRGARRPAVVVEERRALDAAAQTCRRARGVDEAPAGGLRAVHEGRRKRAARRADPRAGPSAGRSPLG